MSLKANGFGEAKHRLKNMEGKIVMLENENLATEVAENTENTAEETQVETPVKTYTEAEVDAIVGKKLARNSAKIRKEYDRKYGELESVLRAGTGKEDVEEITTTFRDFYQKKGINMPRQAEYSARDIEVLAKAEADEVIRAGFDEVVEEVDRLAKKGADNMTAREKSTYRLLMEYKNNTEKSKELAEIGVSKDVYDSQEFKDFAAKFNPNTPIADIYNIFNQTKPKTQFKTMGSMKNNTVDNGGVKDYYSYEEASKFTKEDFDKNPELFKAVEASMTKW